MKDENLIWLLKWYHSYCNGDWEHCNGIRIGTIENPGLGWFLKVVLDETELEDKQFEKIDIVRSKEDWVYCYIEDQMFEGYGGPFNLPEILSIFRKWAEVDCQNCLEKVTTNDENLIWLLQWYHSHISGDGKHYSGIEISTIGNPGWCLRVCLERTELEDKRFEDVRIDRSEEDWICCFIENKRFEGVGGPLNLPEVLNIFRNWAEANL